MTVIIYSIPTLNGLIARSTEKDYNFISDADWSLYMGELKKAGVFVMGRRTFEASKRTGAFPYDCLNVVMTSKKIANDWGDNVIFTSESPKSVLAMLQHKGFNQIILTGGILSATFMKEKLVDEIWVDIMPRVFTDGIPLFAGEAFDAELELIEIKRPHPNEVQLRYKVKK